MPKQIILIVLALIFSSHAMAQDIEITPDMYEFSPNSITGVYVCTPKHVESGDCKDVDKEYYESLAIITLGLYEIGILSVNGIDTMAFKGPLSPGAAERLIDLLEDHPEIDTLVLSSQGGSEEEAYKIADYVKEKGLKTWVPVRRMCLSACTPIFLSGSEQTLDGQLGFHTGQFFLNDPYQIKDLETDKKTIQEAMFQNDQFMMKRVKLFLSLGIKLELIDAMIEAKGDFLVFSEMDELFGFNPEKNYIISLTEMSEFAKNQPAKNFDFQGYKPLFWRKLMLSLLNLFGQIS